MAVQGSIGSAGSQIKFVSAQSLGVTMPANTYPSGTISFDNIGQQAAYWKNRSSGHAHSINLYLCDSAGNNRALLFTLSLNAGQNNYTTTSATVNVPALAGQALYLIGEAVTTDGLTNIELRNGTTVTVNTASLSYTITTAAGTGGTLTASAGSASPGAQVTLYAVPSAGYQLSGYTSSPTLTITNSTFTMPAANVTITASFAKSGYSITKAASPAAGGTVTVKKGSTAVTSANQGDTITLSQTANTGYYFSGYTTSPALTITNNAFTMPASNVTITANYLKRSTATLSASSMTGGGSVTLTIQPDKTTYSHKYQLSFGTNMETSETTVPAGTTRVTISVPASWSSQIPNAASKSGGTLTLKTYSGTTLIGTYTITGLTYNVPASAIPGFTRMELSVARTIGTTTYANVGDHYVQNHCGVRVEAVTAGVYSSTITGLTLSIGGYSGSAYNVTQASGTIDFTSGLLTIANANTKVSITITDSRGRSFTQEMTINVEAYNNPAGTLSVWRVDVNGDADEFGEYGQYSQTSSYTQIGSNSATVTLACGGNTYTGPAASGNIMPDSRMTFSLLQEFPVTLTVADLFEQTVITAKLPSGKFIINVNAAGDKIAFFKVADKNIPTGKDSTFEIAADTQIYIGNYTLEDYIRLIAGV